VNYLDNCLFTNLQNYCIVQVGSSEKYQTVHKPEFLEVTTNIFKPSALLKQYTRNSLWLLSSCFTAVFVIVIFPYAANILFWIFGANREQPNPFNDLEYIQISLWAFGMMSAARYLYTWIYGDKTTAMLWCLALIASSAVLYFVL
jgi:hypothetical protein